jgi:DNA-binding transcriptional MerR regulator
MKRPERTKSTTDRGSSGRPATERYRIDALARSAGTTVRNARSYQEKGLLPPPVREGRVAYYSNAHAVRLRMIGTLLDRGFSLHAIGELVESMAEGKDVRELVGLEEALTSPFTDEAPTRITIEELSRLFGTQDSELFSRATSVGLVETAEGGMVEVRSLRLLKIGADLHEVGIPLPKLFDALERLRSDVDGLAKRLVGLVVDEVIRPRIAEHPDLSNASELTEVVRRIRPLAKRAVDAELSRALENHVRAALAEEIPEILVPAKKKKTRTT